MMQRNVLCLICKSPRYTLVFQGSSNFFLKQSEGKLIHPRKVMCEECGLIYQNPLPDHVDTHQMYEGGYGEKNHLSSTQSMKKFIQERNIRAKIQLEWIEKKYQKWANWSFPLKALEVGASIGILLNELKKRGWEVEGVEPSLQFAQYCKEHFGIDMHTSFFEETQLPSSSYDLIILSHILEHTRDPVSILKKVRYSLKPEGVVFIEIPYLKGIWRNLENQMQSSHFFLPTILTMKRLCYEAGLEIIHIENYRRIIRCLLKSSSSALTVQNLSKDSLFEIKWRLKLQRLSSFLFERRIVQHFINLGARINLFIRKPVKSFKGIGRG